MKRYLCIFLALALLISCTVYPVKAFGVATVSVALDAFISAVLIGLGLMPTPGNDTAFNQLVTSCKEYLETSAIVVADTIILLSPSTGMTYAKRDIIEKIKDWLFTSNTIKSVDLTCSVSHSCPWWKLTAINHEFTIESSVPTVPIAVICQYVHPSAGTYFSSTVYLVSSSNFTAVIDGKQVHFSSINSFSYGYYYPISSSSSSASTYEKYYPDYLAMLPSFKFVFDGPLPSATDVLDMIPELGSLSYIYPDGITISDVVPKVDEDIIITFPDWKELEKQVQEGEGGSEDPSEPTNPPDTPYVPYWPIWSPQFSNPDATLDEVTQEDVWNKGADPSWDPGNSGGNTGSSSGSAPSLPEMSIDLRDFFPFCIPFDIYNLVTMFVAEPVAPVFEWEIPVPRLGKSFELEIDLSAWDGIAQLFRTFELIGFIIGLGWITREKILRG